MSSPPCVGPTKLLDETPEVQHLAFRWGSKRASFVVSRETLEHEGASLTSLGSPDRRVLTTPWYIRWGTHRKLSIAWQHRHGLCHTPIFAVE